MAPLEAPRRNGGHALSPSDLGEVGPRVVQVRPRWDADAGECLTGAFLVILATLVLGSVLGSLHKPAPREPDALPSIKIFVDSVEIELADNNDYRVTTLPGGAPPSPWSGVVDFTKTLAIALNMTAILLRKNPGYRPAPKTFAELERERLTRETRLRGPIHGETC